MKGRKTLRTAYQYDAAGPLVMFTGKLNSVDGAPEHAKIFKIANKFEARSRRARGETKCERKKIYKIRTNKFGARPPRITSFA